MWLQSKAEGVNFALILVPFAGIAFLWFMGVVHTCGRSGGSVVFPVFFGSGLLFLAMLFCFGGGGRRDAYRVHVGAVDDGGEWPDHLWAPRCLHDHQRLRHPYGGRLHALPGHDLGAHGHHAAQLCDL